MSLREELPGDGDSLVADREPARAFEPQAQLGEEHPSPSATSDVPTDDYSRVNSAHKTIASRVWDWVQEHFGVVLVAFAVVLCAVIWGLYLQNGAVFALTLITVNALLL